MWHHRYNYISWFWLAPSIWIHLQNSRLLQSIIYLYNLICFSAEVHLETPTPSLQPPGHTHRFSGSELKGSAWINNRLMTELPGKEPDMPARISIGKLTTGKSVINNKQKTGNFNLRDKVTTQNILTLVIQWRKQIAIILSFIPEGLALSVRRRVSGAACRVSDWQDTT